MSQPEKALTPRDRRGALHGKKNLIRQPLGGQWTELAGADARRPFHMMGQACRRGKEFEWK